MTADGARGQLDQRVCGECNACCSALTIDEPTLKKVPNLLCDHWDGCCRIYESRPETCRQFLCGWRSSSYFAEHWRPDHSNILVRVLSRTAPISVVFHLLGPLSEQTTVELLHAIGGMIAAGNHTFLAVAGEPGENAIRFSLNPALARAVATHDMTLARGVLDLAIRECTERPRTRSHLASSDRA